MAAFYGIANYFGLFFVFAVCALCVSVGFIIVGSRWRKQGRSEAQRNRLVLVLGAVEAVFFLLFITIFIPAIENAGDLLLPNMYEVRKTAGTVGHIMPKDHVPVFYSDGELHSGATYYIDGHYYDGIDDGCLQRGMLIELEYAHGEHDGVILSWREVTPEQAAQTLAEAKHYEVLAEPSPQEKPLRTAPIAVSGELEKVLIWIQYICSAVFLVMIVLQERFHLVKRPYYWNHRQDHRITFNWAVGGFRFVQFGSVHIWIMCAIIRGMKYGRLGGSLMAVALILSHLSYFLYDLTRCIEIDGELVTVSRFGIQRQYTTSEIREVKWEITHKGRKLFGKVDGFPFEDWERVMDTYYALTVIFTDGKRYRFPVDTHLGVRSAYEELSDRLTARGGVPVEEL